MVCDKISNSTALALDERFPPTPTWLSEVGPELSQGGSFHLEHTHGL